MRASECYMQLVSVHTSPRSQLATGSIFELAYGLGPNKELKLKPSLMIESQKLERLKIAFLAFDRIFRIPVAQQKKDGLTKDYRMGYKKRRISNRITCSDIDDER
jgi:hypothetical protein